MTPDSTIRSALAAARQRDGIALMPFLAAGYPNLDTTVACIRALEAAGATMIEIGFPFSDPVADGPTIQEAFTYALAKKVKVADIFTAVKSASASIPLVAMLSYSIVFRYGLERFVRDAKGSGFAGLIIPDLPPPEAQRVCDIIRAGGLDTILLVAPSTSRERRGEIARLSSGFIYYLSVAGITGERDTLPEDLSRNVQELKSTGVPVCVGFGIHRAEHVQQLRGIADGAIVGTAFVRRVKERLDRPAAEIADVLGDYCRELLQGARQPVK